MLDERFHGHFSPAESLPSPATLCRGNIYAIIKPRIVDIVKAASNPSRAVKYDSHFGGRQATLWMALLLFSKLSVETKRPLFLCRSSSPRMSLQLPEERPFLRSSTSPLIVVGGVAGLQVVVVVDVDHGVDVGEKC